MVETKLKDCDKKFLLGHYYLEGAKIREIKNPSHIYGEFKFNKDMVQKDKFDWVIFGHVHLMQTMWGDDNIVIPGSIDRLDMGERDSDKYYCVYDTGKDKLSFKEIYCRPLWKKEIEIPNDTKDFTEYVLSKLPAEEEIEEGICELIVHYPQGSEARLNKDLIEDRFENAFHYEIKYKVIHEEEGAKLRELSLDPLSLFEDYMVKQYEDHQYYEELRNNGTELLNQEMHLEDVVDKGALSIKSVDMQYFNKYGKGPNKVEFEDGAYVIQGPTGSGKSSILDAITLALFKRSSRTDILKIDEILYENGYVDVEFDIGNKILNVRRNHNSPKLTIRIDGEKKYQGLTIPEKEDKIENIVGYDYEGFKGSFFIRQQELQIFSDSRSSDRQDLLIKLFKLKVFDNIYGDLCRIFSPNYIKSITKVDLPVDIDNFPWKEGAPKFPWEEYEAYMSEFEDKERYFALKDMRYWKAFQPPRDGEDPDRPIFEHIRILFGTFFRDHFGTSLFPNKGKEINNIIEDLRE